MTENQLANLFLRTINTWERDLSVNETLRASDPDMMITQDEIWELAQKLAKLAQPRKRYQDLHNSVEGRKQRKELMKGN